MYVTKNGADQWDKVIRCCTKETALKKQSDAHEQLVINIVKLLG